jgi:hypothetical protein
MGLVETLETMCKPLLLFFIFELALICYNLTQGQINHAIVNGIMTIIGSSLIYLLCSMGFEIAAWMMLAIVPFFFVALIAFLVITQLITTDVNYWNGPQSGTRNTISNRYIRKAFGLPEVTPDIPEPQYDYVENPAIDEIVDTYSEIAEHDHDHGHNSD